MFSFILKYKLILPTLLIVLVFASCQKGGEPVPFNSSEVDSDTSSISLRTGSGDTGSDDDGSDDGDDDGKTDGGIIGGDDNEDDDGGGDGDGGIVGGDDNEDDDVIGSGGKGAKALL